MSPFLTWLELYPFIIWNIWVNRNKNNMDNTSHNASLERAIDIATKYKLLIQNEKLRVLTHTINIMWYKSHNGYLKLTLMAPFVRKNI